MLWTAKLRGFDKENILGTRARKYHLTIHYYPINFYEKHGTFYFIASGVVHGAPLAIQRCFNELKAMHRPCGKRYLIKLERNRESFLTVTAQPVTAEARTMVSCFYNPALIHCKPAIIYPSGHEEWEVCAFCKEDLNQIITVGERLYNLKLLSLRRASVAGVQVIATAPKLSTKQRQSLELATRLGYYSYPRKIELAQLAARSSVSLSTFHAHLRKAENRVLPLLLGSCDAKPDKNQRSSSLKSF